MLQAHASATANAAGEGEANGKTEGSALPVATGLNPAFINEIMDEAKDELRFEID
jgi:hypothetical protein